MCQRQDSPRAAVIPCVPPQEYFKAVDTKLLTAPVINVAFKDNSTFRVPTRLTCTAPSDRVDNTVSEHAVCILAGEAGAWSNCPAHVLAPRHGAFGAEEFHGCGHDTSSTLR